MRGREELAWAAGIFEGEGCFYATGPGSGRAVVRMSDKDVILRFRDAVGVGYVAEKPFLQGDRKPQWEWRAAQFEERQAFAAMVWEWLGPRRRAQYRQVPHSPLSYRRRNRREI